MIHKHMYIAYLNKGEAEIKSSEKVVTATVKYFEDKAVLYYEGTDETVIPDDFVTGDFKPFPNGENWFELTEIFHYFTPRSDEEWVRKIQNKEGYMCVNKIVKNKIASYIYYHYVHQENNPINCDKFFSIFIYGDTIFMYGEIPTEEVTWADIEGKPFGYLGKDWGALMNEHFKAWPDGEKRWIKL